MIFLFLIAIKGRFFHVQLYMYIYFIYIHMYRTGDKKVSHMKRHHHICVAFCRWCQVEAEEENQRRVKFRWSFVSSNR